MNIERTAKKIRKTKDIINLVWVVGATGGNNRIRAHSLRFFRCDFRIGVRHCKNNRMGSHGLNHFRRYRPFNRNTKEHVGAVHRLFQCAQVGIGRMGRFPLVHPFGAALINNAFGITGNTIVVLCPHGFDELDTGDPCGSGTVKYDFTVLNFFTRNLQSIDQPGCADHRGAVLVIMKNRYIHDFFELLLNYKALRRFNILKIDTAKCRPHQLNCVDNFVGVFGIQLDIDRVYIGKAFE